MGYAQTRMYRRGVLKAEGFPLADVSEHLAHPDTIVWVDLRAPEARQLDELALELGLHELAVEDAIVAHQRPKLERYDDTLFAVLRAPAEPDELARERDQLAAFDAARALGRRLRLHL